MHFTNFYVEVFTQFWIKLLHVECLLDVFWFYQTIFHSLSSFVTEKLSVTHSFIHYRVIDFINVTVAVDYVHSKVFDIVDVYVDVSDNLVHFLVSLTADLWARRKLDFILVAYYLGLSLPLLVI